VSIYTRNWFSRNLMLLANSQESVSKRKEYTRTVNARGQTDSLSYIFRASHLISSQLRRGGRITIPAGAPRYASTCTITATRAGWRMMMSC
jgi:hypothetical protein